MLEMQAYALDEGAASQLLITLAQMDPPPELILALTVGSSSYSASTTYGSVSMPVVGGTTIVVALDPDQWTVLGPPGAATATLTDQTIAVSGNPDSITLDGFFIFNGAAEAGLWAGSISPTWTPTAIGGSSIVLSGITVTMGQCGVAPPAGSPWLLTFTPYAGTRNDFSGVLGCQFTPTGDVTVTALGRWVAAGNTQTHVVALCDHDAVPWAEVTVDTSGATPGQVVYATLDYPVVLRSGFDYYLVSQEVAGGDHWYDSSASSTYTFSGAATLGGAVFTGAFGGGFGGPTAGTMYVTVSFQSA